MNKHDIPQWAWKKGLVLVRMTTNWATSSDPSIGHPALSIARALVKAKNEQREADAIIAENTGEGATKTFIAAAIRKGGDA